jgi:DNA topoisomerase-1
LNRAVTLLAEKRAGKGNRFGRAAVKTVLKDLGEHPGGGGKIQVLDGKYGPYVSHDKVNATVPKGTNPETLTVDDAIRLLQERIAKGGGKKPARKAASKAAGKAAAKPKAAKSAKKSDEGGDAKPAKAKAKPKAAKSKKSAAKADAES